MGEALIVEYERAYAIVIEHDTSHISEMESELKGVYVARRTRLNYPLTVQYENRGDRARADKFLHRVIGETLTAAAPSKAGNAFSKRADM